MSLRISAILLATAAAAASLSAKGKHKIPWLERSKEATELSAKEKRPLAVLLVQEGSALSKRMEESLADDPRLAEVVGELVWLKVVVGSADYQRWFEPECGANVEGAPSIVIVSPKGASDPAFIGLPTAASPDPDDIYPVLRQALGRAGRKAPPDSVERVGKLLAAAKGAAAPAEAVRACTEALALSDGWSDLAPMSETARQEIERLLQEGNVEMTRIQQEARSVEKALAAYREVQQRYAGTSVAGWAAQEIKRLEKR